MDDAFKLQTEIPPQERKDLVEDYPMLSLSSLGRGLLREGEIKKGTVSLYDWFEYPRALYETRRLNDDSVVLRVWLQRRESQPVSMHQEAKLEGVYATFGIRPYIICPTCGESRLKLFFTRLGRLSCRACLNLTYQCCRENHAKPIFQLFRRYRKLRMKQTEVKRIYYGGKFTRKARSVMRMARGLKKESQSF